MPGIIAAAGRTDAGDQVRRGAMPLLRRPWQRLTVAASPGGDAALGFAGECGAVVQDPDSGVILALDGEVVGEQGPEEPEAAAQILLCGYLDASLDLAAFDGWFAAALWDPRRMELKLFADRMGHRPLYVATRGQEVLAASELKALVAAGLSAEIDLQGWAEMLAYEHPIADHTPLAGVHVVLPGTAVTIAADGRRHEEEFWRYRLEPDERSDGQLVDGFGALLEEATMLRAGDETALSLSGGLDSRCLAGILAPAGVLAASYGAPRSEDLELGTEAARLAGLPHRAFRLESGYIARGAAETVWLAEGHVRCFHAHHLSLSSLRTEDDRSRLLIGFSGDPVVRASRIPSVGDDVAADFHRDRAACVTDELVEALLTPSFARAIRGLARESLRECLADEEGAPDLRMRQYVVRQSHRRKVFPGSELFLDDLFPRDPFDDVAFVEFCRRMPRSSRKGGKLQKAYLRRFGDIAALRNPKEGFAPILEGRRRRLAELGVRGRRGARSRLERAGGLRWLPNHTGLGDYARELRRGSSPILDVLLEPRTLERGQIRGEPVRRLVQELRTGRARHTRALGMLLTLELFQRQFVDGDRLPVAAAELEVQVQT